MRPTLAIAIGVAFIVVLVALGAFLQAAGWTRDAPQELSGKAYEPIMGSVGENRSLDNTTLVLNGATFVVDVIGREATPGYTFTFRVFLVEGEGWALWPINATMESDHGVVEVDYTQPPGDVRIGFQGDVLRGTVDYQYEREPTGPVNMTMGVVFESYQSRWMGYTQEEDLEVGLAFTLDFDAYWNILRQQG